MNKPILVHRITIVRSGGIFNILTTSDDIYDSARNGDRPWQLTTTSNLKRSNFVCLTMYNEGIDRSVYGQGGWRKEKLQCKKAVYLRVLNS